MAVSNWSPCSSLDLLRPLDNLWGGCHRLSVQVTKPRLGSHYWFFGCPASTHPSWFPFEESLLCTWFAETRTRAPFSWARGGPLSQAELWVQCQGPWRFCCWRCVLTRSFLSVPHCGVWLPFLWSCVRDCLSAPLNSLNWLWPAKWRLSCQGECVISEASS